LLSARFFLDGALGALREALGFNFAGGRRGLPSLGGGFGFFAFRKLGGELPPKPRGV